jgi:hypothetical protein
MAIGRYGGNVQRAGYDNSQKILDERFATRSPFSRIRTVNAVNEFNDSDGRQGGLLVAGGVDDALEQSLHAVAATLVLEKDCADSAITGVVSVPQQPNEADD